MKNHHAPLLLPAAALAFGAWAAFQLPHLPVPPLVALAVLGLILGWGLRRPAGTALAFVALGLLVAVLRQGLPDHPEARLNRDLPVEAVVRVDGHWNPDDEAGWAAPARVLRLRQGERQIEPSLDVFLFLPGGEDPPAVGSTLRLRGYLARSAGFANRGATPPGPWRIRIKSRLLMAVESPPGRLDRLSGALRSRVEAAYRDAGPASGGGQGKALARALVLGDASDLPLEWKRALRVTGLYHLMSVSGVHVALVAAAIWTLGGLPRNVRLFLMLAGMGLYLLLVGPLPPLVRAAVMGGLAVLALLAQRPPAAVNALGWAVMLLVAHRPDLVNQPAFQLTVAATAGILLLGPQLAERWSALPHWLATSLAVSVAAQLATLPWILPRFHLLSPASPLLNLVAVPWTGLVLGASLLWTGLALLSPPLAVWFLPALDALAAPFSWPCHVPPEVWGTLPLRLPAWGAWALAVWLGSLLLMRSSRHWVRRTRMGALALTLAALAVSGWFGWPAWLRHRAGPELAMLDVGQGDAILLRDGNRAVLVDGGGWDGGDLGGRVLLPALLAEGIRSLDALVMTHPDRDHCAGLVDISAYLPVREVWMGHGWDPETCAGRLAALPGARTRLLAAGDRETLGGWSLKVLHPDLDERRGENERSLVLLAEAAGKRVLLTGDVESWAEQRLQSCCSPDLRVDVLKVAHHGSRTSTGESFLEESCPRLALISAGRNNVYRHPSTEVLERLERHGVQVLRTDRDGQISVSWTDQGRTRIELPGIPR